MKEKKTISHREIEVDFKNIDRQLLEGFECNQFSYDNKRFLKMIKEQTNSALNNKKDWCTKS